MTDHDFEDQQPSRGKAWLALPLVLLAGGAKVLLRKAPKAADEAIEGSRRLADDALGGVRHVDETGDVVDRSRMTEFAHELGTEGALELGAEAALGDDEEE